MVRLHPPLLLPSQRTRRHGDGTVASAIAQAEAAWLASRAVSVLSCQSAVSGWTYWYAVVPR